MTNTSSTEHRIWAVISHLSSLGFGIGILLPIIGWSDQRRKSNYASFQSLQALGYQSLGFTLWVLSYLVAFIAVLIVLVVMSFQAEKAGKNFNLFLGPGAILIFILLFGFFALYFLLPIVAAIACAFGRDFRYPIMGNRLARYLGYDLNQNVEEQTWLNEDHEFHWVAAMGHFSILILLWGMLAPLTTWILYGKHSPFLKFQSMQTLVYQAGTTILYFVALCLYLLGFFSLILPVGSSGEPDLNSPTTRLGIVIFGIFLLIVLMIMLLVPLLHILGQWAGYRVLKGGNYRYPLIGRWVEKWISKHSSAEEKLT
ncbi:MAG TPA: DUF4870 domain-containing protein [Anaerolineales bacterium]|nr:DUF4870 domain-containing protein [Anaerolineales bacterium]